MCQSELVHFPVRRRSPFSHILRASYCSQRLRDESNALFLSGCGTRLVSLLSVTWEFPRMVLCSAIFSHKTHKLVLSFEGGAKRISLPITFSHFSNRLCYPLPCFSSFCQLLARRNLVVMSLPATPVPSMLRGLKDIII